MSYFGKSERSNSTQFLQISNRFFFKISDSFSGGSMDSMGIGLADPSRTTAGVPCQPLLLTGLRHQNNFQ
jgi:hypothetical protein